MDTITFRNLTPEQRKRIYDHYNEKEFGDSFGYESRRNNPKKCLLRRAESGAKSRNLEFNLTEDDIIVPEFCPLLGIKLEFSHKKGYNKGSPSIDRIDNAKGYIKGNVQIISRQANVCKNDLSIPELIIFAKNILEIYDK